MSVVWDMNGSGGGAGPREGSDEAPRRASILAASGKVVLLIK